MVTKTVTVARLLVTHAVMAVCYCCRCGSACRYDCLRFLVICYFSVLVQCGRLSCLLISFLWNRDGVGDTIEENSMDCSF